MGYHYYDSPKGEDIFSKLLVTSKYAGAAGIVVSTCDVMLHSYPKTIQQTLGRYMYFTGPFIATAAAFTITSNVLASTRKKDDRLNYFLGGVAAGITFGAWRGSFLRGFLASLAFGVIGCVKKDAVDNGWVFLPEVQRVGYAVNTRKYDWTLTKERPKNWTTGEN